MHLGEQLKRLDKPHSRKRWAELRDLWNAYDPIGVMGSPDSPSDEYDCYVGPMMRLLERDAPEEQIVTYLEGVSEYMGLEYQRRSAVQFVARARGWFNENWRGTVS